MDHDNINYRKLDYSICKPECKNNIKSKNKNMKILGKGGQGIVYLYEDNKCGKSALKISNNIIESTNETFFLEKTKQIVNEKICPHYIYNYCSYVYGKEMYMLNEYADGTLENWLSMHHTELEWCCMLFQIIYSLYVFQKKIYAVHNDLKPKNILFKQISQGRFEYIVGDERYYVPTCGYLFMMADYGKSESLLQANNNKEKVKAMIQTNTDYEYISSLPKRILVSAAQNKYGTIENLLKIFDAFINNSFETYMDHEKNKINKELEKYPQKIKDKMLLRSMIYYMIEKHMLKCTDIENKYFYEKYPPGDIDKIINNGSSMIDILKTLHMKIHNSKLMGDILDTFMIE